MLSRALSEGSTACQYWVARAAASGLAAPAVASPPTAAAASAAVPPVPLKRAATRLFDVDANLTHPDLACDVAEHLESAAAVGVVRMVVPGASLAESRAAAELARHRVLPSGVELFVTAGIHPYNVEGENVGTALAALRELASSPHCVAIGETGLDFSPGFPPRVAQLEFFEPQAALAAELGLPLFLHERSAHADFVAVLERHRDTPKLIHCFSGSEAELRTYLAMPASFVSVSGLLCKLKRGKALRAALTAVGPEALLGRVMVETDAPYLGFKGCRRGYAKGARKQSPNVPSALPLVVAQLAKCLGVSEARVAAATTAAAEAFFGVRVGATK